MRGFFRKKSVIIVLSVIAALLLAGGGLLLWQWRNLRVLTRSAQFTPQQITQQMSDNKQNLQEIIDQNPDVNIRDVTDEEREAFRDGSLSREELIERIAGQLPDASTAEEAPEKEPAPEETPAKTEDPAPAAPKPEPEPEPEKDPAAEAYQQELNKQLAEIYVMREEYTLELESMLQQAMDEYAAFTDAQRSPLQLIGWASGYYNRASALEKQCDSEINAQLEQMKALIRENNGDESLTDKIYQEYVNEKSLKKSYYMAEVRKRGII